MKRNYFPKCQVLIFIFRQTQKKKVQFVFLGRLMIVCVAWSLVNDLLQSFSLSLGIESVVALESALPIIEEAYMIICRYTYIGGKVEFNVKNATIPSGRTSSLSSKMLAKGWNLPLYNQKKRTCKRLPTIMILNEQINNR